MPERDDRYGIPDVDRATLNKWVGSLPGYDEHGMMVDPKAFTEDYLAKTRDIPGHPDYNDYVAAARAASAKLTRDAQLPPAAVLQRIVERRIAAGHAAEEATIRAELVAAVRDAMATADKEAGFLVDWDCMADETVVDWQALAEAATAAVVEFLSKPREVTDVR